jgi:hypothetical protein
VSVAENGGILNKYRKRWTLRDFEKIIIDKALYCGIIKSKDKYNTSG